VGDGPLVNFGYPKAHEDDAARAGPAGLAIVAALPDLTARVSRRFPDLRAPLQVRIGLHTGLVVVGALGDGTYRDPMAVIGETPNIAARLQGLAAPDTVAAAGQARRCPVGAAEVWDWFTEGFDTPDLNEAEPCCMRGPDTDLGGREIGGARGACIMGTRRS